MLRPLVEPTRRRRRWQPDYFYPISVQFFAFAVSAGLGAARSSDTSNRLLERHPFPGCMSFSVVQRHSGEQVSSI